MGQTRARIQTGVAVALVLGGIALIIADSASAATWLFIFGFALAAEVFWSRSDDLHVAYQTYAGVMFSAGAVLSGVSGVFALAGDPILERHSPFVGVLLLCFACVLAYIGLGALQVAWDWRSQQRKGIPLEPSPPEHGSHASAENEVAGLSPEEVAARARAERDHRHSGP